MVKPSLFPEKHSNNRHPKLKLRRFWRAGREIIGCLKKTRLMLQILRPDVDIERMVGWLKDKSLILQILRPDPERGVRELIYESAPPRPRIDPIQAPNAIGLQLHFKSEFPSEPELFTSTSIEPVDVVIRSGNSEEVEFTGPLSSIEVEMVVLDGKFVKEDWTEEDFNLNIVEGRKGRRPLLIGDTVIELKDGSGTFADIKAIDNSHWKECGFRLGVRVVKRSGVHGRIREARSKAFVVKDIRGKSSKKCESPSPTDEIWLLKNIRKGGVYFNKLNEIGIKTVQELLQFSITDPESLRKIGMAEKKLGETLTHARKCTIDTKYYSYSCSEKESMLLLNSIYEVVGVKFSDFLSFQKLDDLHPSLKYKVEILKQKAYKNKEKIEEYNEEPLLGPLKPQEVASIPETSTVDLLNPPAIRHPNETASSSFNHFINVSQGLPMIVSPQQQVNGDGFSAMHSNCSNVPTAHWQPVYDAGFHHDLPPSPPFPVSLNQSNTSGATDFCIGLENCSLEALDSCWHDIIMNCNGSPDSGIQRGHASFHGSVPSIHVQLPGVTGVALNWPVLKVLLVWKMQLKKMVAAKRTEKVE